MKRHSHAFIHMQKSQKDWPKVKHFDMHLNGIISIRLEGTKCDDMENEKETTAATRETRGIGTEKQQPTHNAHIAASTGATYVHSGPEILFLLQRSKENFEIST